MKMQYIQPTAVVVSLYAGEDVMVAMSQTTKSGTEALSNERDGWNSSDWTSDNEEE